MKKHFPLLILFLSAILGLQNPAHAFYSELGFSYARKLTTFDENNSLDTESTTGSISFFLLERMALELSYTEALGLRKEKASTSDPKRTTTQKSTITGSDLIITFTDKKALLQPYIKGGVAQISRLQEVKIEGQDTYTLQPEKATVPSYGAGLKIQLTETFGIKLSYDIWKTPVGGSLQTDDSSIRAGVSWIL